MAETISAIDNPTKNVKKETGGGFVSEAEREAERFRRKMAITEWWDGRHGWGTSIHPLTHTDPHTQAEMNTSPGVEGPFDFEIAGISAGSLLDGQNFGTDGAGESRIPEDIFDESPDDGATESTEDNSAAEQTEADSGESGEAGEGSGSGEGSSGGSGEEKTDEAEKEKPKASSNYRSPYVEDDKDDDDEKNKKFSGRA